MSAKRKEPNPLEYYIDRLNKSLNITYKDNPSNRPVQSVVISIATGAMMNQDKNKKLRGK